MSNCRYRKVFCVAVFLFLSNIDGTPQLGVDRITPALIAHLTPHCTAPRIGLVTNQTGVGSCGTRTVDILVSRGFIIKKLFAPEHGITGSVRAGQTCDNSCDPVTGIPIISLYRAGGDTIVGGKSINPDDLIDIDLLLFDIQDSGMRHYTYISTLYCVLDAAGKYNIPVVILDRPNPLGAVMEGPLVDDHLRSFIGIAPIPVRHGMTMGELARYFVRYTLAVKPKIFIVVMRGYHREQGLVHFLAPLSPNIQVHDAVKGYSFLGLLGEIAPFDVGVGTPHAFSVITLPCKNPINNKKLWDNISELLKKYGIITNYIQYIKSTTGICYRGVAVTIKDINKVPTVKILHELLKLFKSFGVKLRYNQGFDRAMGIAGFRAHHEGLLNYKQLAKDINGALKKFFERARTIYIYRPWPQLILL